MAQEEHDAFADMLRQEGVEVVYLEDLVAEALDAHPEARRAFCERWLDESGVDGAGVRSAVSELLDSLPTSRALVDKCVEGVRADELDLTPSAHASLADLMALSAGRTGELVIDPIPNVYFTRDTFSVIGQGVSHNRMWSVTRRRESIFGDFLFAFHPDYAGTPSWYSSDQPYHIEPSLFVHRPDYLLRVRGMSMRDAGIMDGDLLAVQSSREARNGQIVVARLGDDVTVKRFHRLKNQIELHAENPDYPTIVVQPGEPFEIEGLAVGLIRNSMLL